MKQLVFIAAVTLAGTLGVFVVSPFWGVAVYYFFAILRPQFIWEWALPRDVQWSRYVALATIAAALLKRSDPEAIGPDGGPAKLRRGSFLFVYLYFFWVTVTYFTARDREVAWPYFNEYLKVFAMFIVSTKLIDSVRQLWFLLILAALTLGYISADVNHLYLSTGYLTLYRRGYGGLDNNGAALMLAMGVPLCIFAWDATRRRLRWAYMALVPFIIHAVLMTYSRGAMVSLIAATPLIMLRCRHKVQIGLLTAALVVLAVPAMAGPEIRARFFTISEHEQDESAQSRKDSWAAAWRMAKENPILGVGVRNANLFSHQYGADMEGRTIHSQYLQIAADNGIVGLGFYLAALGSIWLSTRRARRAVAGRDDVEGRRARAIASGVECSMAVFCIGGAFLSLETFELPFLLLLIGGQLGALDLNPGPIDPGEITIRAPGTDR